MKLYLEKIKDTKIIHILIIIIGTIFISISAFHTNIWFDESYSVGLATHTFKEIWQIGGNDVHPILYYWLLHIIYIIFGTNIIAYRLFSILGIVLLGLIGYTHIRKDFGAKVGLVFSYLSFFMPVMCVYAVEIRMYSLAITFAILTGIYAYRIIKESTTKNWIIFAICSLALSYTHYYGLMTAGLINLGLFIFAIKTRKENKNFLKTFIIQAIVEIALYIPWLVYFVVQVMHVGGGFWISLKFPNTLFEILNFQYKGIIDGGFVFDFANIATLVFAVILYLYLGYLIYKEKKQENDIKPGILALAIYLAVILVALVISKFMAILYSRYLFVITGFLIFALSYFLVKEKRKIITIFILVIMTIMSLYNEYQLTKENYAKSNKEVIHYIEENIEKDDIIIYSKMEGSLMSILFPNNKQYFFNYENWDVEEAYKAFGPQMETVRSLDFLDDYKGRIWILVSDDKKIYDELENINIIKETKTFSLDYHSLKYNIMLVEKNK